jgi:sRNA-binding protein
MAKLTPNEQQVKDILKTLKFPFAKGIEVDIRERYKLTSRAQNRKLLYIITRRPDYLAAVIAAGVGGSRYDLSGNVSGSVSQAEYDYTVELSKAEKTAAEPKGKKAKPKVSAAVEGHHQDRSEGAPAVPKPETVVIIKKKRLVAVGGGK